MSNADHIGHAGYAGHPNNAGHASHEGREGHAAHVRHTGHAGNADYMGHAKPECYSGNKLIHCYYGSNFLKCLKSNNSHASWERQRNQESHIKTASMERMRSCLIISMLILFFLYLLISQTMQLNQLISGPVKHQRGRVSECTRRGAPWVTWGWLQ